MAQPSHREASSGGLHTLKVCVWTTSHSLTCLGSSVAQCYQYQANLECASFCPSLSRKITLQRVWNFRVTSEKSLKRLQLDWSSAGDFGTFVSPASYQPLHPDTGAGLFASPVSLCVSLCRQAQELRCATHAPQRTFLFYFIIFILYHRRARFSGHRVQGSRQRPSS